MVEPPRWQKTGRLQRFRLSYLNATADSLLFRQGETVPVHEFHYWDTTENRCVLEAVKPRRIEKMGLLLCVAPSLYAGFPHLHFSGAADRRAIYRGSRSRLA